MMTRHCIFCLCFSRIIEIDEVHEKLLIHYFPRRLLFVVVVDDDDDDEDVVVFQ
jgi:hypothetical protein